MQFLIMLMGHNKIKIFSLNSLTAWPKYFGAYMELLLNIGQDYLSHFSKKLITGPYKLKALVIEIKFDTSLVCSC